ncbi:hypothetical protein ACQ4PT_000493 [Festuca glaucescens]
MRNPAVMEKLQGQIREVFKGKTVVTEANLQASELRYLKLVMKEALRLHPPAPLLVPRESIDVCELEGYTISAKSRVVINAWAIGRDPRMCPGFNYGLASMELALVTLLYHFDLSLPERVAEVDMEEAPGLGVRRRTPLMLLAMPFVPVVA